MSTALGPDAATKDATGTTAPATGRSLLLESWPGAIGYLAVVVVLTYFALAGDNFATLDNLATIAGQASVYAVAGFGLAVVVIAGGDDVVAGGIDLSVGAVAGLSGAMAAVVLRDGLALPWALLTGLGVALAVGALNAASVAWGVRPLLATLATGAAASSVTLVITGNAKVIVDHPAVASFRDGDLLGVPAAVVVLLAVFAVVAFVLGRTPWGVGTYAVGQNPVAARVAGLSPGRYVAASYLVSGALAGVAGLLFVGRFSAAVPDLGNQVLLDVLLTTFLAVVFSRRTTVTVTGVLVGALFVAALSSGFTQVGVESQWVGAVKGALIAAVLAVAALRAKGARR